MEESKFGFGLRENFNELLVVSSAVDELLGFESGFVDLLELGQVFIVSDLQHSFFRKCLLESPQVADGQVLGVFSVQCDFWLEHMANLEEVWELERVPVVDLFEVVQYLLIEKREAVFGSKPTLSTLSFPLLVILPAQADQVHSFVE